MKLETVFFKINAFIWIAMSDEDRRIELEDGQRGNCSILTKLFQMWGKELYSPGMSKCVLGLFSFLDVAFQLKWLTFGSS